MGLINTLVIREDDFQDVICFRLNSVGKNPVIATFKTVGVISTNLNIYMTSKWSRKILVS